MFLLYDDERGALNPNEGDLKVGYFQRRASVLCRHLSSQRVGVGVYWGYMGYIGNSLLLGLDGDNEKENGNFDLGFGV